MNPINEILSQDTRQALRLHLGQQAASELLQVIDRLAEEIKHLSKTKVSVTPIVPHKSSEETVIVMD